MNKIDKVAFPIRLPFELKEQLAKEAQNKGYSLNEYILILIHKGRQC